MSDEGTNKRDAKAASKSKYAVQSQAVSEFLVWQGNTGKAFLVFDVLRYRLPIIDSVKMRVEQSFKPAICRSTTSRLASGFVNIIHVCKLCLDQPATTIDIFT